MLHPLSRLAEKLQIDRPLLYALSSRAWQAMAGPLTMIFLISSLTLGEQGVYYSLSSIMSIQLFFELGLLNILISQAGHQSSQIASAASNSQRQVAQLRMSSLIQASKRWFFVASLLFVVAAIGMGWRALSDKVTTIQWWSPLIALSMIAGVTIALSPRMAILEGAGFRDSVYRSRLMQMVSGAIVVWVSLLSGLKVWALVASASVQLVFVTYLTLIAYRSFFQEHQKSSLTQETNTENEKGWSWLSDVLPLQWRIALISIVYHAATQFFTVIVLRFHGEQEAGRLGMTLSATGAIQSMALAWVHTKFSLVSTLHGSGKREEAGTLWRRSAVVSTVLLVTALLTATAVVSSLPLAQRGWENRFIQPWQMLVLSAGCFANHLIALQSFYVLSRQGRPFMTAALVGFLSTGLAVLCGGYHYSTTGIVVGYAVTTALVTLPLHSLAYLRYRSKAN
ncbi:MAG: hypothetical protein U0930_16050 [Pirellulales bacterium]